MKKNLFKMGLVAALTAISLASCGVDTGEKSTDQPVEKLTTAEAKETQVVEEQPVEETTEDSTNPEVESEASETTTDAVTEKDINKDTTCTIYTCDDFEVVTKLCCHGEEYYEINFSMDSKFDPYILEGSKDGEHHHYQEVHNHENICSSNFSFGRFIHDNIDMIVIVIDYDFYYISIESHETIHTDGGFIVYTEYNGKTERCLNRF